MESPIAFLPLPTSLFEALEERLDISAPAFGSFDRQLASHRSATVLSLGNIVFASKTGAAAMLGIDLEKKKLIQAFYASLFREATTAAAMQGLEAMSYILLDLYMYLF